MVSEFSKTVWVISLVFWGLTWQCCFIDWYIPFMCEPGFVQFLQITIAINSIFCYMLVQVITFQAVAVR